MTKASSFELQARAAATLGFLLVASIVAYGGLILLMVQETSYRARAEAASRVIVGELGSLEQRYIAAEETVTLERAQMLGFVETKQIARANRLLPGVALSLKSR